MVTNHDPKSFRSRRKNSKFAPTTDTVDFFDPSSVIWDPLRGELPHVQIFMNEGPNPITSDAQLLSF